MEAGEELPPYVNKFYDKKYERWYFYNHTTKKSGWSLDDVEEEYDPVDSDDEEYDPFESEQRRHCTEHEERAGGGEADATAGTGAAAHQTEELAAALELGDGQEAVLTRKTCEARKRVKAALGRLRQSEGMTQKRLAAALSITPQRLSSWLGGKSKVSDPAVILGQMTSWLEGLRPRQNAEESVTIISTDNAGTIETCAGPADPQCNVQ